MISNLNVKATYNGNGLTRAFPITFAFTDKSQIYAVLGDGTAIAQTDFTVDTGAMTVTYPKSNDDPALATGETITIYRVTDKTQQADLTNQGGAWPETIEDSFDKLTQIVQEMGESVERSVKVEIQSDVTPAELMETLKEESDAAIASAAAAALSETNAGNSATAAHNSEVAAAGSEEAAEAILADIEAAAQTVGGIATVYDPTKQYKKADQVMVENGDVYRCIEPSLGEYPPTSGKWVLTATGQKDTFERDGDDDLVPCRYAQASDTWGIDDDEDIYPRHIA